LIHAIGENPEKLLSREALITGATTQKENITDFQLGFLRSQLRELIKEEIQYK
jgi:hypothetical protein